MGLLSSAAGVAQAGADVYGTIVGKGIASSNLSLSKENLAYQKWAQQQTWDREDNATQRKVADLKAAGLSPVLAAGSASPTSAPIQTQAPQEDSSWSHGLGSKVGSSVGTAMNLASTMAGIEQQMANISKTRAEEDYTRLQTERSGVELGQIRDLIPLKYKMAMLENAYKQGQIDKDTLKREVDRYNYDRSRTLNLRTTDSISPYSLAGGIGSSLGSRLDPLLQLGGKEFQKMIDYAVDSISRDSKGTSEQRKQMGRQYTKKLFAW